MSSYTYYPISKQLKHIHMQAEKLKKMEPFIEYKQYTEKPLTQLQCSIIKSLISVLTKALNYLNQHNCISQNNIALLKEFYNSNNQFHCNVATTVPRRMGALKRPIIKKLPQTGAVIDDPRVKKHIASCIQQYINICREAIHLHYYNEVVKLTNKIKERISQEAKHIIGHTNVVHGRLLPDFPNTIVKEQPTQLTDIHNVNEDTQLLRDILKMFNTPGINYVPCRHLYIITNFTNDTSTNTTPTQAQSLYTVVISQNPLQSYLQTDSNSNYLPNISLDALFGNDGSKIYFSIPDLKHIMMERNALDMLKQLYVALLTIDTALRNQPNTLNGLTENVLNRIKDQMLTPDRIYDQTRKHISETFNDYMIRLITHLAIEDLSKQQDLLDEFHNKVSTLTEYLRSTNTTDIEFDPKLPLLSSSNPLLAVFIQDMLCQTANTRQQQPRIKTVAT